MLYFLVVFVAITAINQLDSPQVVIHRLVDSCPSIYSHNGRHNTIACTMPNSFPDLDLPLNNKSMRSIWHLYYMATGRKTHNTGHMTHSMNGRATHNTIGRATQDNVTADGSMTNILSCPSCQCHHINIMPAPHNLFKKTESHITFMQPCSKATTIFFYVLPHKHRSNDQFDQKMHKHYKSSALPLAINHGMYYLLKNTFNDIFDVNNLINRLLLMLQRYITRRNDFKHRWFMLLLSGLLRSKHISLRFLIVLFLNLHIVNWRIFWFQRMIYIMTSSICIRIFNLGHPSSPLVSNQNIKSTTFFVGGGRSARTEFKTLKPYVLSTEVQLKNPDEFSYVYGGHCSFDSAMQEMQMSGEVLLICNIPLALVANILTSTQANEVAKEHNLHALSRKSLAEKRTAVESHVCTKSCNQCVTVFKPVKKIKRVLFKVIIVPKGKK